MRGQPFRFSLMTPKIDVCQTTWETRDNCLFSWCLFFLCFLFPPGASTGQYAVGISAPVLSPFCVSLDPRRQFRGDLWHILQCELVTLVAWVVMTHRWGYSSPAKPLPAKQPHFFILFPLICLSLFQKMLKSNSYQGLFLFCTISNLFFKQVINKWKPFQQLLSL